jgi:hypothetical protein
LGGLIALLVIALAVTVTVLVVRPDSDGPSTPPTNGADSEFASANDTGPVNIITEDPTCDAWGRVVRTYADKTRAVAWEKRDPSAPASSWTPEQRSMYESVGDAMEEAGDQARDLSKLTPNRVMRELYQQFIAYGAAFKAQIPTYIADDDSSAVVTDSVATAISHICSAIQYRSAQAVAPLVAEEDGPSAPPPLGDSGNPPRFLTAKLPVCSDWSNSSAKVDEDLRAWLAIDPKIAATDWTPEQKAINDSAAAVMANNASELAEMGRSSGNAVFEDFAVLAAQYERATVKAIPNYTSADGFLSQASTYLVRTVNWACKAAA